MNRKRKVRCRNCQRHFPEEQVEDLICLECQADAMLTEQDVRFNAYLESHEGVEQFIETEPEERVLALMAIFRKALPEADEDELRATAVRILLNPEQALAEMDEMDAENAAGEDEPE